MSKLFLAVCAAIVIMVPVGANATDQNIVLQATVAKYCTIAGSLTPTDDVVTIGVTGGVVSTATITRSYAVVCNSAAAVTLTSQSGAMLTSTTSSGGFDTFINYRAGTNGFANIATAATTHSGTQVLGTTNTAGAASATLNVTIQPINSGTPLAGGDYTDTLKVSITPIM